jgi:hypothetical protein
VRLRGASQDGSDDDAREADAFYKVICFDAAYREKMAGALRQAGLPE